MFRMRSGDRLGAALSEYRPWSGSPAAREISVSGDVPVATDDFLVDVPGHPAAARSDSHPKP